MQRQVLFIVFCLASVLARGQQPVFDRIGIEEGMSQGMAFNMCQTRDGFLWVATKGGLNRYDGYRFKVFNHDSSTPFSIAEDYCTSLLEDRYDRLWIGLANQGVDLYDARTNRFHHIRLNFPNNRFSSDYNHIKIYEASDGSIWVIQRGSGLARIRIPLVWSQQMPDQEDLTTSVAIHYFDLSAIDVPNDFLLNLWESPIGNIIVCSTQKRFQINLNGDTAQLVASPFGTVSLSQVEFDGHSEWALSAKNQLFRLSKAKLVAWSFPGSIWTEGISFLAKEDRNENLWLSFDRKLWLLNDLKEGQTPVPVYAVDQMVTKVMTDKSRNIWIGTNGYGMRRINPLRKLFNASESGLSVWRVWHNPQGAYFWGKLGIIAPYDPITGQLSTQTAFPEVKDLWQRDLIFEPDGSHWLLGVTQEGEGTGGWLIRYDAAGRMTKKIHIDILGYSYAQLFFDSTGALWITGLRGQLIRMDRVTEQITYHSFEHLFQASSGIGYATDIVQDAHGVFWIGTQLGLVQGVFNGGKFDFKLIQVQTDQSNGLNNNSISCLLPDPIAPHQVLWIGTKGGGINRFDMVKQHFTHITIRDGFPDRIVYGILPGNEDPRKGKVSLWCSTNRGIAQVVPTDQPEKYDILTYTMADGLQDNEFNTLAFTKTTKGELVFGGINGINRFVPESIQIDSTAYQVKIVGISANLQTIEPSLRENGRPLSVEYVRNITLRHDQNDPVFEFAVLDFTDPKKTRYRYRLAGLQNAWVDIGYEHRVQFSQLPAGTYTFQVQANNGNGMWHASAPITVVVLAPWWRSSFAYLVYCLLLVGLLWSLQRNQLRRVQMKAQLASEQREKLRLAELEQMKTNFFNNITHEFRTPLTLIIEPIRRILAQPLTADMQQHAKLVEQNSQQLLGLVNQLLELAKLDSGQLKLDMRVADLNVLFNQAYERFTPLADLHQIQWELQCRATFPSLIFDVTKVEMVLNNLLSNAFKFTPAHGKVILSATYSDADLICIQVTDTGKGIPFEDQAHVFDRFFQSKQGTVQSGTGIGLALSRELAKLMGGQLTVKSEPGQGSVFSFTLPIETSHSLPSRSFGIRDHSPSPTESLPVVLLVEDNEGVRTYLHSVLHKAWQVLSAKDGAEGLLIAREQLPDIVVSDVMMPHKDGFELCETLKQDELTAHIPVILLTAKTGQTDKLQGLTLGADDYLSKPFDTDELLQRMQNLVENRQKLRQIWQVPTAIQPSPKAATSASVMSALNRNFMERLNALLEAEYTNPELSVEQLAQQMYVSRVQLFRKIKALTGQNVSDLIRDFRLDRAKVLLEEEGNRVYEVAEKVGFGNEKYFSTAFKARFGVSPSQI
jgi:signal transduction histidine kinase/DNA-binding response OmpR family regulator